MRKFLQLLLLALTMAVVIRSVQNAAITSGGPTQDFAHADFNATDPVKGAIVFGSSGVANGTQVDHGLLSFGFTDGTSQYCATLKTRDGQALGSQADVNAFSDRLFSLYTPTADTQAGSMGFSSFAADKLVGSWSPLPPAAWLTNALLLGGPDLSILAGTADSGTTQDAEQTKDDSGGDTGPSFPVDMVLFISRGTNGFNGTSTQGALISIGWAVNDNGTIRQGCRSWIDLDSASTQSLGAMLDNNRIARALTMANPPAASKGIEITALSDSIAKGFKHTLRDAGGGSAIQFAWLALGFNGKLVGQTVRIYSPPTSAGSDPWTTPGHAPQAILGVHGLVAGQNAIETTANSGPFGVGVMTGASEEFSSTIMSQHLATTSNTKSLTSDVLCECPGGSGSAGLKFDGTSFDSTGATFDHTSVLSDASRPQLLVEFGRNAIRGRAQTAAGEVGTAVATVVASGTAQMGTGRVTAGALGRAIASVAKGGRAKEQAGAVERAVGSVAHGGRARAASGAAERGQSAVTHAARASSAQGAVEAASGVSAHGARARASAGSTTRGAATASHGGRALASAGSTTKATGVAAHGGQALTSAGLAGRGAAHVAHAGRARTVSGSAPRAQAMVPAAAIAGTASGTGGAIGKAAAKAQRGGRATSVAGDSSKAEARAAHGGRARLQAGDASSSKSKVAHGGRARGTAGAAPRAQAVVQATAVAGTASVAAGAVGKAAAKVQHGTRARATSGEASSGKAKVAKAGRAKTQAGEVAKARASKVARGRAAVQAGGAERAPGKVQHGASASSSHGSAPVARGKHSAFGRARTVGGALGAAGFTPEEALGFYERTSKRVRQRLKAVAGLLPIQYSNLRFSQPSGAPWARARVNFGEDIEEAAYGAGAATYIVPGALLVELRVPILRGNGIASQLADDLAELIQMRETSGVIYSAAEISGERESGTDDYVVTLRVPFRAEDSRFARATPGTPAGDDFAGAEEQIRRRFRSALPALVVSYDNLPPTTGATWVKLAVFPAAAFNVDGVRRETGVMIADVHVPLMSGEKQALRVADQIVENFRAVDIGGVKFSFPTVSPARDVRGEWVQPVHCPWSCDHA